MRTRLSAIYAPLMLLAVAGCMTPQSAYVKTVEFDNEGTFLTDARVRMINRVIPGANSFFGIVDPLTVTCVEPSPDVAVAVANSFGVGISVFQRGAGSLTGQQVEGLAQIAERTTAIQALLKQGYQACLDYANGAINRTTYSLRTSRLDDLLVTLVLAEDATGAFGRSGAAIGTAARAEAQAKLASFPQAQEDAAKTQEDLNKAETKVIDKQAALEKAKAERAAAPTGTDTKALDQKVAIAEADLAAAKAERDLLLSRLSEVADTMSSAAGEVNKLIAMGGIDASPDPRIAQVVGDMQERFLDKDVDQAFVSTCLVELGLTATDDMRQTASQLAPELLKSATDVATQTQDLNAYYDTLGLSKTTKLFEYCEAYLPRFLAESTERRHEFKMRRLDLEIARLNVLAGAGIASRNATAPTVYPLADFTAARAAQKALTEQKTLLTGTEPVTTQEPDRQALISEKRTLLARIEPVLNLATTTLTDPNLTAVETLEKTRISLLGEPGRFGTTEQRATWQATFDLLEAQAQERHVALKDLTRSLEGLTKEATSLIQRMKAPQ